MTKTELNLIIKQLFKRKLFTWISFCGLLAGYWVLVMITSFVYFEYSYDRTHRNADPCMAGI